MQRYNKLFLSDISFINTRGWGKTGVKMKNRKKDKRTEEGQKKDTKAKIWWRTERVSTPNNCPSQRQKFQTSHLQFEVFNKVLILMLQSKHSNADDIFQMFKMEFLSHRKQNICQNPSTLALIWLPSYTQRNAEC